MVLRIMQKIDEISNDADKCKMRQVILACFDFIICLISSIDLFLLTKTSSNRYGSIAYTLVTACISYKYKMFSNIS